MYKSLYTAVAVAHHGTISATSLASSLITSRRARGLEHPESDDFTTAGQIILSHFHLYRTDSFYPPTNHPAIHSILLCIDVSMDGGNGIDYRKYDNTFYFISYTPV